MNELTQKLLTLDSQTDKELKMSNQLAQEMMLEVDARVKKMMREAEKVLEKQKANDLEILSKNIEKRKLHKLDMLERKMQDFDEHFNITELVEHLVIVAKEKVCP